MTNNTRRADGAGNPHSKRKNQIAGPELYEVLCALGHETESVVSVNTAPVGGAGGFRATTQTVGSLQDWTPPNELNVWFSPNPLKELLPRGRRGRREDVATGLTLYADLDVKEGALTSMDECAAVVDKLAAALGVSPVVVIHSGHGLQPIWRVRQPNPITDAGTTWITISERWGVLVRDTVAEVNPSAATDSTFNIDRILRCPGSTNWKDEAAPVPAWCELNGNAGWLSVSDLELVLPDVSVDVAPATKRGTNDQAQALAAAFRGGAMSPAVTKRVNVVLGAIETGNLRHESMNSAVQGLVRLGAERHRGVPAALGLLREAFSEVSGTRGDPDEFGRSLRGALRNVAGSVDLAALSFDTGSAFEPGGAWHRDTGWVPNPDDPRYKARGVSESAGERTNQPVVRFATVSATDLAKPVPPMPWLVRGVWPQKSFGPMGGAKKTLKSYNLLSMAVAVASGSPFFGEFEVVKPGPVVFYVGEGGQAPFQRRLQAIARAYDVDLRDLPLHAVFEVGALDGQDFTDALKRNMDNLQPELVIVDPLYAFHPSGIEAQNLYERGRMLAGVSSLVANDTALIIADHFKKTGAQGALDLDSIAQSGMSQWADSWILQNHREPVDLAAGSYRLEVEFGSRQWGGSRWDLDWQLPAFGQLEEGEQDAGVSWAIRRSTDGDGSQAKGRRRSGVTKRGEILNAIRDNPFQLTQNQLVDAVGGNRAAVKRELARLEEDGHVVTNRVAAAEGSGRQVARDRYGIAPNATFTMNEEGAGAAHDLT